MAELRVRNHDLGECRSHGKREGVALFTLIMWLSYTIFRKMGFTASNFSHLPTKASFPESSSPPSLPPSLCGSLPADQNALRASEPLCR